jgi:cell division protein FtsB
MGRLRSEHRLAREGVTEGVALVCLLLLAGFAIAGPSGVLAWGENQRLLEQRRQEVQRLAVERDELRNRVDLLDPRHADSDLAGELLRRDLNVVHPDEMVMFIK